MACALSIALTSFGASAAGHLFSAEPMQGEKVRIDGDLREWSSKMTELDERSSGGKDPRASAVIGYDDTNLYVVLKLVDKRIVRTAAAGPNEDHATLFIAFPKGRDFTTYEVELFPGKPGRVAGVVKLKGSVLDGAKIVEAPSQGGLNVEASIPWSTFAEADRVRVGLHAAVTYTDADGSGSISGVIGTSSARSGRALPPLLMEAEAGLEYALLRPNGISSVAAREAFGNVAGDAAYERVAVFGKNLAIVGSHYRGGKEFLSLELGVVDARMVTHLDLVDFDGDGHDEIVVRKRFGADDHYREILTVSKIGTDDTAFQVFAHEVGIKTSDGRIQNRVSLRGGAIEISQGEAEGFDPATYAESLPSDMASALLPWESVGSKTYKWNGKAFEKTGETGYNPKSFASAANKASAGDKPRKRGKRRARAAAADEPQAIPPPRPPTSDELLDRVYALYKKDRGASGRPSFDFVTDVAGDDTPERVVIHGRDMLIFGKNFRGGTSYAFIGMGVADASDILDATALDLTGDGKAEIVVRAVLHAKASKGLGGGMVERRALLIYGIKEDALVRLFGAETSRAVGSDQILGAVAFEPKGRAFGIELRPAHAVGWTQESYPFPADTTTAGGLEPLLLPWGNAGKARRYVWSGTAYELQ